MKDQTYDQIKQIISQSNPFQQAPRATTVGLIILAYMVDLKSESSFNEQFTACSDLPLLMTLTIMADMFNLVCVYV